MYVDDSRILFNGSNDIFHCNDILREVVFDCPKVSELTFDSLLCGEFVGNLNINCLVAFLCNKVNLSGGDNSYIYIKFLNEKMVAYNVLNDFFNAAKNIRHLVDDTVAKTMVAEVIFLNQLENTLTMYVISGELINNERIGYGLNILCCYIIGHLGTLRFEIFHYAVDRDKLSYIICKKENQVFQKI